MQQLPLLVLLLLLPLLYSAVLVLMQCMRFKMSASIRIKDDVYKLLESNAKGFESVSDTISRSVHSLEVLEAFNMICRQVESSLDILKVENVKKEKTILVHYNDEAKLEAIEMAKKLFKEHEIDFNYDVNYIKILVKS